MYLIGRYEPEFHASGSRSRFNKNIQKVHTIGRNYSLHKLSRKDGIKTCSSMKNLNF